MPNKKAKILVTLTAIACVVIQPIADFNSTHMFNHLWPPHARFHGAWLMFLTVSMGLLSLYLLWGKYQDNETQLAFVMAAILPALAWGNFMPALLLPDISTWPDGTESFLAINPNLVVSALITLLSLFGIWLDNKSRHS